MKKILIVVAVFLGCLVWPAIAAADPVTNPTHFDDTYWTWPLAGGGLTTMETLITPEADGSPDGYYFSAYYWFAGDYPASGGYLGLQTNGANPTGKIAIFSLWGATSASSPGIVVPFTEGTSGYSARIQYPWIINHVYDLKLSLTSQGGGSNTWTAWVTDTTAGGTSLIGTITVPASRGTIYGTSVTFHERYSGATGSCSDMHKSQVTFTNLSANNGTLSPSGHSNVGPTGSACANLFATEDIAGGIRSVIGGTFAAAPAATPTPSPQPAAAAPKVVAPTPTPAATAKPVTTPVPATPQSDTKASSPPKPSKLHEALYVGLWALLAVGIAVDVGLIFWNRAIKKRLAESWQRYHNLS